MLIGASHLVCSLVDGESARDLRSSSSVHHAVVFDEVTDHTQCIVEGTFGFFNDLLKSIKKKMGGFRGYKIIHLDYYSISTFLFYHFVATADEDGHSPGVFALLDDQHVILGGAEGDLLHHTRRSELLRRQLAEPGHDAASCCYGNQLQGRAFKNLSTF